MTIKLGTIDLAGLGSSNSDNVSITQNSSNKLQTIGVINQNDTTEAFKVWVGTKDEYDALEVYSNDTIYNITDEQNDIQSLLEMIYPIGSIYIGTMNICPLSALFGTWTLVSSGRVLQGADENHLPGTTIEAGLPNITGSATADRDFCTSSSGSIYQGTRSGTGYNTGGSSASSSSNVLNLDASRSSSIYGNSDTVQPPAFVVNIWKRTE